MLNNEECICRCKTGAFPFNCSTITHPAFNSDKNIISLTKPNCIFKKKNRSILKMFEKTLEITLQVKMIIKLYVLTQSFIKFKLEFKYLLCY